MDAIVEIITEVIMVLFVEVPMESENVKTWIKTAIFLVICWLLDILGGFLFYQVCFVQHDVIGSVLCGAVLLFLLGLTIFGAIDGHKRGWKQDRGY